MSCDVEHLLAAWNQILDRIRTSANSKALDIWLPRDKVRPLSFNDGIIILSCPTTMMAKMIRQRYVESLCVAATEVLGTPVTDVIGRVSGEAYREHEKRLAEQERRAREVRQEGAEAVAAEFSTPAATARHRAFKQLSSFVVGNCNRLAHEAVQYIINDPDNPVNPLFIHSSSGLGKTHLIQGLATSYREKYPTRSVQYMRCEQFTNEFITACSEGPAGLQAFRVRLRHADLLLIDDIHFLSKGQMIKSKEELFEMFKELTENGKKVVITSDAAPSDIKYLEQRFVQCFTGGLVAPLDRPDLDVRRDIVREKAKGHESFFGEEVVDYIADNITDNIRELEGAVNKIVYMARSLRRQPDIALARQALSDTLSREGGEPRLKMILRAVADRYDLSVEDITGNARSGARSEARHIAMYLYKESGGDTYEAVGQAFGKTHAAASYACQQAAKYRSHNADTADFIDSLLLRVRRG